MVIKLISTEMSPCCNHEAQIVRSREGGLISRGCLKCDKSDYVNEGQLPNLPCVSCQVPMEIAKLDRTNYFYSCLSCKQRYKIADIVPPWNDVFPYSGLAAYGDQGLPIL